jgi:hypothetical protein
VKHLKALLILALVIIGSPLAPTSDHIPGAGGTTQLPWNLWWMRAPSALELGLLHSNYLFNCSASTSSTTRTQRSRLSLGDASAARASSKPRTYIIVSVFLNAVCACAGVDLSRDARLALLGGFASGLPTGGAPAASIR